MAVFFQAVEMNFQVLYVFFSTRACHQYLIQVNEEEM